MKLCTKDVEYELLCLSSNKRCIFEVNFRIKTAFKDAVFIRVQRLLKGNIYFTVPFINVVFISGRHLKEEIRYLPLYTSCFVAML